jgi:CMP-N-acetylneuraminic acid synthetase
MKKISAVINARLNSSRMQSKMIRPFHNSDLLEIALEKLDKLSYFDKRYIAVAEDSLIDKASKYKNIEVLKRNSDSVEFGPHHPMTTFEHYLRIPTEYFFVINACAAFLSLDTIKRAYDNFQESNFRSYISAVETRDWVFNSKGEALTHTNPDALQNTSDGDYYLRATHAFYIANRDYFSQNDGKLWDLKVNDPYLIKMPVEESFDVDSELDFKVSELIYKNQNS